MEGKTIAKRESWASRIGFILAAAGSAIGLGTSGNSPIWLGKVAELLLFSFIFWLLPLLDYL